MKKATLFIFFLIACGGKMSDDQRRKFREGMSSTEIEKISEGEILDAAFSYGRMVASVVEKTDRFLLRKVKIDSLNSTYQVRIYSLQSSNKLMVDVEKQILNAYLTGNGSGTDNVQKMGVDTLLFTRPQYRLHPDGSEELLNVIAIKMPRKVIVLSRKD